MYCNRRFLIKTALLLPLRLKPNKVSHLSEKFKKIDDCLTHLIRLKTDGLVTSLAGCTPLESSEDCCPVKMMVFQDLFAFNVFCLFDFAKLFPGVALYDWAGVRIPPLMVGVNTPYEKLTPSEAQGIMEMFRMKYKVLV